MPYADALQRFAQMAGKPLIAETAVEGSLTFTDPQPYSYGEALDTLNLILATKNVMLVEVDRYLRLVPFKQLPQLPLKILRGLEQVGDLRPGEVVTVVLDLKNLDAGELSQPISSMLSSAGSVASLSRGRGLIVTDRLANIQRVRQLLTQIDTASPVQRELKTYTLRNASGTLLADIINRTFGIATAPKRTIFNDQRKSYEVLPPDPTDYVTAIFAQASNTLVLFGPSGRIELAHDLIERFESQSDARASEVRVFYPQMAPDELASLIRQAIPGVASRNEFGPDTFTKAKVIADTTGNRLVVTAPAAGQMDAIAELIFRLDPTTRDSATTTGGPRTPGQPDAPATAAAAPREMRLIDLKSGSAQFLVPMLREAIIELGRNQTGPNLLSQVRLQPAPNGNRILATGTPDSLNEVTRLIEQLDSASDRAEATRVFRLRNASANRVAGMIQGAFASPDGRRRGGGGFVGVAAEERSNCLVVAAGAAQMKLIEEIINRLEEAGADAGRQLRVLDLHHNSAASLAAMVSQLFFAQIRSGDPNQRLALTASPDDRALVVEADDALLTRVTEAVEALDVEPARATYEVRTYALPEGRSGDLAESLNRLFAEPGERRRGDFPSLPTPPAPRFELDRASETLIVAATADQFVRVEKLLADLRSASALSSQIRTFRLRQAEPAQVIEVLQSMLLGDDSQRWRGSRGWRAGAGNAEVRIAAATALNAVVVQASPEKLAIATQLIETLDRPRADGAASIQTLQLKKAQPEAVASAVMQALAAKGGPSDRPSTISVTAVPGSRSLLVSGPTAELQRVIQLIRDLDEESSGTGFETKVYRLENGKARDLARVVTQLLEGLSRAQPRFASRFQRDTFTVTADERINALVVSATPDGFKLLDHLLPTLDQAPQHSDRQVEFYWLQNANALDLAFRLDALFTDRPRADRPLIDYDLQGNGLTVVARAADLVVIADVIQKLDGAARDTSRQVRMIPLSQIPAERMAAMLTNIYAQVRDGQIRVVDRLPPPAPSVPSVPSAPSAPSAPSVPSVPSTNTPAPPPEVVIAVNQDANALIVSGPATELDHIQSLVYDLSSSFTSPEFEIRQFRLREADPVVVARVLNELFRPTVVAGQPAANGAGQARRNRPGQGQGGGGDGPRPAPANNPQPGQPGQPNQAQTAIPKVAVVAESRTHSVIVRARPTDFPLLESIIQQLDEGGLSSELAHRLVRLEHVTPERILPLVRQLLNQLDAVRPGERAAIASDPRSRSLFLVGRESVLEQMEALARELDTASEFSELQVRTFPLKHAQAAQLAALLKNMLRPDAANELTPEARQLQEQVSRLQLENPDGQPIGLDLTQPIKLVADPAQPNAAGGANRLVIASTPDNLAALAAIVALLDTPSANGMESFRIFALRHADAASVQRVLTELTPPQTRPEDRAVLSLDERSNALVATGTEKTLAVVARLVEQLDVELPADLRGIRILPLQNADATSVASALQRLLDERARPRGGGGGGGRRAGSGFDPLRVVVIADPRSNSLLVSASPENFELVQGLLAQLDQPASALLGQIRLIPLQHADAQALASTLADLFVRRAQTARTPDQQRNRPVILADPRSNSLLVAAGVDDNQVLDALLRQLDSAEFGAAGNVRLFPLQHARASSLSTVLERFFRAKRAGETAAGTRDRSQPVTVTADDRTNTLLVTGGREAFEVVERMIEQLDTEKTLARTTFRVVELRHATATKVQATLQRLFTNRPSRPQGEPVEPVTIIADGWSNSLILGGTDEDLALALSLVEKLDTEQPTGGTQVQVFQLSKADARRVSQTLQTLFRASGTGGGGPGGGGFGTGGPGNVAVNVDERLNALIVSAGEADLKRIEELLKKLDTDQVARVAEIRIFPLKNGRANEMATVLNNVLNNNPRALTEANPNRQSLLQFIARTEDGERLVTSALKEGIILVPDARANSLVVSAPVDYMDLLTQMIQHLDDTAPTVAQIKVFNLKNADARQMAQVLTTLFRLQPRGPVLGNQQSVEYTMPRQAAPAPAGAGTDATPTTPPPTAPSPAAGEDGAVVGSAQEDALSVTVDLRTNSLLVGGTEHYVSLAAQIIETLDDAPGQERKAEVVRLKNSRAQSVETALRTFLQQDLQRIVSVLGPTGIGTAQNILDREVSIVSETNANSLLISASPRYFAEVKQLVEQLDLPQPQVLIQVLLAEVTLDNTTELGVEWRVTGTGENSVSTGTDFAQQALLQTFGGYWATVAGNNYQFLIRALQNEGRLEVLSRPQILTADNQEATINIGQRVPLITDSRITDQGDTINQFTYENIGVILRVTPRISPDGYVKMDLAPSISDLSSSKVDISKGVSVPVINQRTATTAVTVKSGQSVLLGGLIGTVDDVRTKKVPVLGDIPGLGFFFRSKSKSNVRKELLIVLTPQVLLKGSGEGTTLEAGKFTEQELLQSDIRDQIQRDRLQRRILDPIYPPGTITNNVPDPNSSPDSKKKRK
jgi:type II secretion system protein D